MVNKYRSYAVTISTFEPVEGEFQKWILNYLKKCDYSYAVIEGGPGTGKERHCHFQTWYEEPIEKGSLKRSLKRAIEKYCPESKPHIALRIKIAYNDDWLEEYMTKEVTELMIDSVPTGTADYYPSKEEQEKVQASANATDSVFHDLSIRFHNSWNDNNEIELVDVARFMATEMFKNKTIRVIIDKKNRVEKTRALWCYLTPDNVTHTKEFMTKDEYDIHTKKLETKY